MSEPTRELVQKEKISKSETLIRLLSAPNDEEFRKSLEIVKTVVPRSVVVIDQEHTGQGENKLDHTFSTLELLDTSALEQNDKFIARTGMMLTSSQTKCTT